MDLLAGFSDARALTNAKIDANVVAGCTGVYILDKTTSGAFVVSYVGRSDYDVAARLKAGVTEGGYALFRFKYMPSAAAAYELECQIYHAVTHLDNEIHPDAPNGSSCTCPIEGCSRAKKAQTYRGW